MITTYSRFAFAALLCCGLFLINHNARAQCPDSTGPVPNPDSVPWLSDIYGQQYIQIPGTDCYVTYDYCSRYLNDSTVQVWISDIIPDSGTSCDSLTGTELIEDVGGLLAKLFAGRDPHTPECIKVGRFSLSRHTLANAGILR